MPIHHSSGERWKVTVVDANGARLASGGVQKDGTWSIGAVRDGAQVWVHATATGQTEYATAGPVMPGREDVVLRAKTGRTITGRIEGLPASASNPARAWVAANGQRGWRSTGSVKPDGTFAIFGLPPGTYTVQAWTHDSEYQGEVRGVRDGAKDVTVSLQER